jgi:hypothetical protein
MPEIKDWHIQLTADDVLRLQGADPDLVRQRRPYLFEFAQWAVQESLPLLEPRILIKEFKVLSQTHERLYVVGDDASSEHRYISGRLIGEHLSGAQTLIVMLCTIGDQLEETASLVMAEDPMRGLALDAAGSAAVEVLATSASHHFENLASQRGLQTSIPLNPGMVGWPVEVGQPQIFALLVEEQAANPDFRVLLNDSHLMYPRKTISLVLGQGANLDRQGKICDYCSLNETCRYQDHYPKK